MGFYFPLYHDIIIKYIQLVVLLQLNIFYLIINVWLYLILLIILYRLILSIIFILSHHIFKIIIIIILKLFLFNMVIQTWKVAIIFLLFLLRFIICWKTTITLTFSFWWIRRRWLRIFLIQVLSANLFYIS